MAIDDKTRKLLWGRSGNRCAICKRELVLDRSSSATEAVVGDECHIVSDRPGGPRHDPSFPGNRVDTYDNLLLLCRVHHKMVDDQSDTYTADRLRSVKAAHETWVRERLSSTKRSVDPTPRRIRLKVPTHLVRLWNGKQLLDIVVGADAFAFDHDEDLNSGEAKLVGGFLQTLSDYGDLGLDIEPAQRVDASVELSDALGEIESAGFFVFGGREVDRLETAQGASTRLVVAIVQVLRQSNAGIIKISAGDVPGAPTDTAAGPTDEA
jgi:hypothetical protein